MITEREDGEQAIFQQLRESLRLLPEGTTTVPFTPNGTLAARIADLEAAGLTVDVVETLVGTEPGVFLGAEPDLGTAVPENSTVTLTVSGKPDNFPEQPTADGRPPRRGLHARRNRRVREHRDSHC